MLYRADHENCQGKSSSSTPVISITLPRVYALCLGLSVLLFPSDVVLLKFQAVFISLLGQQWHHVFDSECPTDSCWAGKQTMSLVGTTLFAMTQWTAMVAMPMCNLQTRYCHDKSTWQTFWCYTPNKNLLIMPESVRSVWYMSSVCNHREGFLIVTFSSQWPDMNMTLYWKQSSNRHMSGGDPEMP